MEGLHRTLAFAVAHGYDVLALNEVSFGEERLLELSSPFGYTYVRLVKGKHSTRHNALHPALSRYVGPAVLPHCHHPSLIPPLYLRGCVLSCCRAVMLPCCRARFHLHGCSWRGVSPCLHGPCCHVLITCVAHASNLLHD